MRGYGEVSGHLAVMRGSSASTLRKRAARAGEGDPATAAARRSVATMPGDARCTAVAPPRTCAARDACGRGRHWLRSIPSAAACMLGYCPATVEALRSLVLHYHADLQ